MEFDEYDYLEKAVENPEPLKIKEHTNGSEETGNYEEKDQKKSSKRRSEEDDYDRRSKHSKSGEESRDRDKVRVSSRRHASPRDGDRSDRDRHRSNRDHRVRDKDKDKSREDRNGKERDRHRGVERDRDHGRERREHGRKYEKERDKESDQEQEQPRRSGSRSERIKDERDRERSQERELKHRENRETNRENRRYREKKEDGMEPEVDPERDQRTVFAYQISLKADERDVYEFFSRAGKVRDVRLIMDRNSRRSKGVGYIEFYDAMSVPMAIALSGQPLLGQPVMVKPSEAEKNLVQSTAGGVAGSTGPYSGGARRLYVGNLHYNIKEDQLRQVFEPFGTVELVQLPTDDTGNCKGYGFIQFARLEDARAAQSLNGQLEIAGQAMKVSAITDQAGMQEMGINPGDLDDDEGGGLSLNAHSRALLMQKLDRSGTTTSVVGSLGTTTINSPGLPTAPILGTAPGVSPLGVPFSALSSIPGVNLSVPSVTIPSVESIGIPSECLLLKNMFDPELEEEPDFDLDIKEDVQSECSKHGKLRHIYVDKNTAGFVYLRFENTQSAIGAQRALHGRWFAGKMITATFMLPQNYEAKFSESK